MSGSIPKEFISDIVDMTDIVSLVDSYLPLKRKGKDHWGICPFCDDGNNTPDCNYDGGACCNQDSPFWNFFCTECACIE